MPPEKKGRAPKRPPEVSVEVRTPSERYPLPGKVAGRVDILDLRKRGFWKSMLLSLEALVHVLVDQKSGACRPRC